MPKPLTAPTAPTTLSASPTPPLYALTVLTLTTPTASSESFFKKYLKAPMRAQTPSTLHRPHRPHRPPTTPTALSASPTPTLCPYRSHPHCPHCREVFRAQTRSANAQTPPPVFVSSRALCQSEYITASCRVGAGITATVGSELDLQSILMKKFPLYSFLSCSSLSLALTTFNTCCLPWIVTSQPSGSAALAAARKSGMAVMVQRGAR